MSEIVLKEILKVLNSSPDFLSSQDLSFIVGTSDRTVRYEINQNRELLAENGFEVISKPKLGYKLKITDDLLAVDFLKNMDFLLNQEVGDVKYFILTDLLFALEPILIEDLADLYYVSRSTVYRIINQLQDLLRDYDLLLDSKTAQGLLIVGRRTNRLACLKDHCINALLEMREMSIQDFQKLKRDVSILVFSALDEVGYQITESNSNNLVMHILMMLELNDRGFSATSSEYWNLKDESIEAAKAIVKAFEKQCQIVLNEDNMMFIALHLQAKQLVKRKSVTSLEYSKVVNNIIAKINRELGYNFVNDQQLMNDLILHFEPMLFRVRNGMNVDDSLVEDIKLNLHEGFECGLVSSRVIADLYNVTLSEGEIALLALHFGVAIERLMELEPIHVLIISSDAAGITSLLKKRVIHELSVHEDDIRIVNFSKGIKVDLDEYDLIFSTMPLSHRISSKVIYINNVLTYDLTQHRDKSLLVSTLDEMIKPDDFYCDLHLSSKDEVLDFISEELKSRYQINKFMTQSVKSREEISTTEIANSVALPHPIIRSDQSIVMVMILTEPIIWDKKIVQCVVFVSHQLGDLKQERRINNSVAEFVHNFDKVKDLIEHPSYDNLIELIA